MTRLSRWSVDLVGLFFTALVVMRLTVASGQEGGETVFDNWWICGPALISLGGAAGAFVTGVIAVTRRGERALAVMMGPRARSARHDVGAR